MEPTNGNMVGGRSSGASSPTPTAIVVRAPEIQREMIAEAMKLEIKQGQVWMATCLHFCPKSVV